LISPCVAVRCRTSLLKLLNHLHLIACNSFLIQQVDVFDMAIIKNKIKDIVIMNLTGFVEAVIELLSFKEGGA
jgi:protein tyrosine phosphatase